MIGFQIVGISLLALLAIVTLAAARRGQVTWVGALAWTALWVAAALAIAYPGSTIRVANWFGIGRGADLVLYTSILAGFAAFFLVFVRFRRLEQQLTLLVRQIALRDASTERPSVPGNAPGPDSD